MLLKIDSQGKKYKNKNSRILLEIIQTSKMSLMEYPLK